MLRTCCLQCECVRSARCNCLFIYGLKTIYFILEMFSNYQTQCKHLLLSHAGDNKMFSFLFPTVFGGIHIRYALRVIILLERINIIGN